MNETIGTESLLTLEKEALMAENLHVELLLRVPKAPKQRTHWSVNKPKRVLTEEQKARANERRRKNRTKNGPKIQTNYNSKVSRYIKQHTDRDEYEINMKKDCGSCGVALPGTIEYYEMNGNYCVQCCRVSEMNSQSVRMAEKDLDTAFRSWVHVRPDRPRHPLWLRQRKTK